MYFVYSVDRLSHLPDMRTIFKVGLILTSSLAQKADGS